MADQPLVSIVTPSYNQGQFLEETILSVLSQDYPNIEYIIIDGGSTDGSVDIIRKYEHRLAYWVSEKDRGQTHALIKGFERASGKHLAWLCSDDMLESSMVSISVDYHLRHPEVGLTYGDRVRIDAKGNIYTLQKSPSFRPWFVRWGFSLPQETTIFRRDVYDSVGGLDESLHMAMDFDLWCKINQRYIIRHIPAVLGRFRAHKANKSTVFTKQTVETNFAEGFPEEFARVYARYFGNAPSWYLISCGKILRSLVGFLDRRTVSYRKELDRNKEVRLA